MSDGNDKTIFAEGAAAGRDCDQHAIDCPYLPGVHAKERGQWLKGFASSRAALPPQPASGVPLPEPTPHAG